MEAYYTYILHIFGFAFILFPSNTKILMGIFPYVFRSHYNLFNIDGHIGNTGDTVWKFLHL